MFSLLPKVLFPRLIDLQPEYLKDRKIKLLMLDFDNTMLPYTTNTPTRELLDWIDQMRAGGVRLCIVSNSRKPRVRVFSKTYGVDVITDAKKPFQRGIRQCLQRYGISRGNAALCGDQIFTDVLGANLGGLLSIHVKSIHNHNFWLKLRHVFEVPILLLARGRRYTNEKSG